MTTTTREEIKLQIENVRHKKVDGTLYCMSERIGWMPKQKNSFTVSHNYVDIKTQKISTEGKVKIQLQIVLHDDTSTTFHFNSPGGQEQQLKDRDMVKDMLANMLPKFKQKINKELEEKKRILVENPHIYQLYSDLVVGQLIPAEDFWASFVDMNDYKQEAKNQSTGVSQGFMANICPKSDGGGLVYNITYDDIQSVFKTYPAVRLKYIQNVPHRMSENDFWTKFFQSYYYRRDQNNTNDMFSDCSLKDEEEIQKKTEATLVGPVSVIGTQKTDFSSEEGFGLTEFLDKKGTNVSNQNLIKRYNYYSMRVLSSMEENGLPKDDDKVATKTPGAPMPGNQAKKIRLDEEILDLEKDGQNINLKGAPLNLTHIDRYFYAPKANDDSQPIVPKMNQQIARDLCRGSLEEMSNWNINIKKIVNPSLAINILKELSPGGSELMQANNEQTLKDEIPKANKDEIKSVYFSSIEILKAFYRMFPPKNNDQEAKLASMKEALDNFYHQRILGLQDRLIAENFPWNLTTHLENMFKIALTKYNTWKMKQGH